MNCPEKDPRPVHENPGPINAFEAFTTSPQSYCNFLNVPSAWTSFFATDATYVYRYEREIYDMKKLKTYYVNPDDGNICYRVSLVEDPAIESEFVYMAKQDERREYVSLENNEKHMVYSATLIPDKPIYRYMDGEEFNVVFTAAAIERIAKNFMKGGFNHEWNLEHGTQSVSGLTATECWIKTDMEKDKSVAIGLDPELPVGSWFLGLSVDNPVVWQAIKDGNWTGFSVEVFVGLDDEIKMAKDMTKENVNLETIEVDEGFWSRLVNIIKDALRSPEQPEEQAEEQAEQAVEDIKEETPAEENLEETPEDVPVEEVAEDAAAAAEEVANENTSDPNEEKAALEETISKLEEKVEALNEEIETLRKENQKLSKQPSAKEIKAGANNRSQADTMAILRQLREGSYFKR